MLIFYILISLAVNSVNAMAGGVEAKSSTQYPFSVTLTDPILCGGSIISLDPPWILTAAHCVESYHQNDKPSVMYGNRNFTKQSVATIKRTVMHPLYLTSAQLERQVYTLDKNDLIPYDIALIELTEPLIESDHVKRIPILINDTLTVQEAETIGMGYTGISQPHAELLQSTFCNLSNTETLKSNNFNHSTILVTSDAQLCHGDSGIATTTSLL
jgi:secreted trypsin-like serine protease